MNTRRLTALMAGVACLVGAFAAGCNNTPADEAPSPDAAGGSPGVMGSPGAAGSPGAMASPGGSMMSSPGAAPPGPGK